MIWCINIFLFNFTKYTMYFGMDIPIALLRPELILIVQILLMNVLFVPLYTYIFTPFGVQEYVRTPDLSFSTPIKKLDILSIDILNFCVKIIIYDFSKFVNIV